MISSTLSTFGARSGGRPPGGLRDFSDVRVDAAGTYAVVRFQSAEPICPMVLLGASAPDRKGPKGPEFRSSSVVRAVVMSGKADPDFEHEVMVLPVSGLLPGTTYHLLIKGVGHCNAVARFSTLSRRIEWWFDRVETTGAGGQPLAGAALQVAVTGDGGASGECGLTGGRPPAATEGPSLVLGDEDLVTMEVSMRHDAPDAGGLMAAATHALSRPGPAENHVVPFQLKAAGDQGGFDLAGRLVVSHG